MPTLEARVARLEKSARRWKLATIGLLLGGGAVAVGGAVADPVVDTIRAKRIHVVNDQGTAVGILAASEGDGILLLKSKEGGRLVSATATAKGSNIHVDHANGKTAFVAEATDGGAPSVRAEDSRGNVVWQTPAPKP